MSRIPDFTDTEIHIIQSTVNERYRSEVPVHLADAEVSLDPDAKPVPCPTVFWDHAQTSFVIFKTGESRFRCQFFGRDLEMYGTGKSEYDDLGDCVITLLQVQADQERQNGLESAPGQNQRR